MTEMYKKIFSKHKVFIVLAVLTSFDVNKQSTTYRLQNLGGANHRLCQGSHILISVVPDIQMEPVFVKCFFQDKI